MRRHNFMNVQTLAILQMCCYAVGDFSYRRILIGTAIRLCNELGIPFKPDEGRNPVECEISRRLWWTFIICEW